MTCAPEKPNTSPEDSTPQIGAGLPSFHSEEHIGMDYSIEAVYAREFHRKATLLATKALARMEQENSTSATSPDQQ